MKNSFLLTTLSLCFWLTVFSGCKNPEHTAFVSVGSIGQAANAAIGAYMDYEQTHPISPKDHARVKLAVSDYLNAMEAVRAAVTAIKNGNAKEGSEEKAIDALSAASGNVVAIVSSLTKIER